MTSRGAVTVGLASVGLVGTGLSIMGSSSGSGDSTISEYRFSFSRPGRLSMLLTLGSLGDTMTFGTTSSYRSSSSSALMLIFKGGRDLS